MERVTQTERQRTISHFTTFPRFARTLTLILFVFSDYCRRGCDVYGLVAQKTQTTTNVDVCTYGSEAKTGRMQQAKHKYSVYCKKARVFVAFLPFAPATDWSEKGDDLLLPISLAHNLISAPYCTYVHLKKIDSEKDRD